MSLLRKHRTTCFDEYPTPCDYWSIDSFIIDKNTGDVKIVINSKIKSSDGKDVLKDKNAIIKDDKIYFKHDGVKTVITLGKDGSRAYYKGMRVEVNGFLCNAIETTGAGDTFCGCVLNYVIDHGIHGLTKEELEQMLAFANGAAALITTRKGALKAMPERAEVEAILYEQGNKNVS